MFHFEYAMNICKAKEHNKIYNIQLTQPVNCHIIIIERSPLTLWS